jgi:hypothetical protein
LHRILRRKSPEDVVSLLTVRAGVLQTIGAALGERP